MTTRTPIVVVLGGPNGAGKSTTAARLLQGALSVNEFVNADTIAQGLSAYRPDSAAIAAGRVMLARLRYLARIREDFAFETTLAGRGHARWLESLRATGYRAHLTFLWLAAPDLAVARVAERARRGGHVVPEEIVRRRYAAGLRNLGACYLDVVDSWQIFDNSGTNEPRLVASKDAGASAEIADSVAWQAVLTRT
jgi:predicted ABC-type ATPase